MRGPRAELWANIPTFTRAAEGKETQNTMKEDSSIKSGTNSALGNEYSSFASFLHSRTSRNFGFQWSKDCDESKKKRPTFKVDPPTFKFKADGETSDMEEEDGKKSSEADQSENGGKKRQNDDDDEWIQSPFCGDRYRKKDVDMLVAFANKYIKSANESTAKRRKLEGDDETSDEKNAGSDLVNKTTGL